MAAQAATKSAAAPATGARSRRARCQLLPDLLAYLNDGGRKIDTWYGQHHMVTADFSTGPDVFLNLNTPEDRQQLENKLAACQEIS